MELQAGVSKARYLVCSWVGKIVVTLPKENQIYEIEGGKLLIEGLIKGKTVANVTG